MLDSLFERVRKLEQNPDLQPGKDDSEAHRLFFSRFQELLASIEPRYAWFITEDLKRNRSQEFWSSFTLHFVCMALGHIQKGEPFEFSPQLAELADRNIEEDRSTIIQSKRSSLTEALITGRKPHEAALAPGSGPPHGALVHPGSSAYHKTTPRGIQR